MQQYEAKVTAMSVAFNLAVDDVAPPKSLISSAVAYMCGKMDEQTFVKKCEKSPTYANAVLYAYSTQTEFNLDKLCAAHKFIYKGSVTEGEIRNFELTYLGASCTNPKMLRGSLKEVLSRMQAIEGAPNESKSDFAARLCCYVRELIILSPFAYGNGVTRRAFIQAFCRNKGFVLNYAAAGKKAIAEAEKAAFLFDETSPLYTVLVKCLSYASVFEAAPPPENSATNAKYDSQVKPPLQNQKKQKKDDRETHGRVKSEREQTELIIKMQRQMDEMRAQIDNLKAKLDEKTDGDDTK